MSIDEIEQKLNKIENEYKNDGCCLESAITNESVEWLMNELRNQLECHKKFRHVINSMPHDMYLELVELSSYKVKWACPHN